MLGGEGYPKEFFVQKVIVQFQDMFIKLDIISLISNFENIEGFMR